MSPRLTALVAEQLAPMLEEIYLASLCRQYMSISVFTHNHPTPDRVQS